MECSSFLWIVVLPIHDIDPCDSVIHVYAAKYLSSCQCKYPLLVIFIVPFIGPSSTLFHYSGKFYYVTSRSWRGMGLYLPGYLVYYLPVLSILRPTQRCCFYVVMGRMSQSVLVTGVIQLCMVQILHHHLLAILTFSCILAEPMTSRVCKNCTYV